MLLAAELALVAIDPESGRHALGTRDALNACMAGLLIAELTLDGAVTRGDKDSTVVPVDEVAPASPVLAAAREIVVEKGPKVKHTLSHMSRGLTQRLGAGTWDTMIAELAREGAIETEEGGLRDRHRVLGRRDEIVARLRVAAAGDDRLDPRTALVLSMTGPAQLLEVVAPDRSARKHARQRIDHALDESALEPIGATVRAVLAEAAAVVAATVAVTTVAATSG
jgi:hypothetical protein